MTSIVAPICMSCLNYRRDDPGPGFRCSAFPEAIPDDIIMSRVDHRKPIDGDNGIVWTQDSKMPTLDQKLYDWILGEARTPTG